MVSVYLKSGIQYYNQNSCDYDKLLDGIGIRFVKLEDNSIMTLVEGKIRISGDGGKAWYEPVLMCDKLGPCHSQNGLPIYTHDGVVILVCKNSEYMLKF